MNWWLKSTKRFNFTTLNYINHFLILWPTIIGCVSISAFSSLADITIGTRSSTIGLKICAIAAGIEQRKSIIKKKKKKHEKIVFLAKSKLNSIKILIFWALIDSFIDYDEFVLINNVLTEYKEMKV